MSAHTTVHAALACGLVAAILGAGCATTEEERRAEQALEALDGTLPEKLDRLLERWSASAGEANRTSEEVYRLRLERMLRDPDTLFAVRAGLQLSDETIVATCAAALGFAPSKGVGKDLLPLLHHENDAVRSNAVLSLYLLGGQDCPIAQAMEVMADPDSVVRQQAALLVARVLRRHADQRDAAGADAPATADDDAYYGALLAYYEALSDIDLQVRVNVAQGMGTIGNPAAASVLVERGLSDPSPVVRYSASQSIAALRPASEAEAVLAALQREFNQFVKRELHSALRAITGLDIGSVDEWERRLPEWRAQREGSTATRTTPAAAASPTAPTPPSAK